MECPTCRYAVLADWSMCRRCGAPLHNLSEVTAVTIPSNLPRRRSALGTATAARPAPPRSPAAEMAASIARDAPTDTLLPGALPRRDNLLPRATARPAAPPQARPAPGRAPVRTATRAGRAHALTAFARRHWRRALVTAIVAVALTMSLFAVWPVVFSASSTGTGSAAAQETRATSLLRTVATGAHALYAPKHTFATVTPKTLAARSHGVKVVAATTVARVGQVSMRAASSSMTIATPADSSHCVFAIVRASSARTQFATVKTATCRAQSAPKTGWSAR